MWDRDIRRVRISACRTLNEAFPRTADYACAVERPADKEDRIVLWGCAFAAVALILVLLLERA